jgi:hypothetical protein
MSSSARDQLLQHLKTVTFSFSSSRSGDDVRNFTLSSYALDLRAEWPLVGAPTYYFPLKRSSSVYMLGRTFLQENHISVDYERGYFDLSQSAPWTNRIEDLVSIISTTRNKAGDTRLSGNSRGMSPEVYAGIALGIVLAIIAIASMISWERKWWPFRSLRKGQKGTSRRDYEKAELHGIAVPWVEVMGQERTELQAREQRHELTDLRDIQAELPVPQTLYELDANERDTATESLARQRQE